ncbi:MAG: leukotoxin LktA family filamentous adhesin, partial [Phascolarctobacterium sp.]|nr:leukotoxin LktA family filamentous adhesin [Phascolarctobacterium sp.]
MSIFRKYTRKQEKSESKDRSLKTREWVRKIGMSLLALGYAAIPKLGEATEITGTGSSAPKINTSGSMTDIYAGTVKGQVAVNTFDKFSVSQGHTANMHFNKYGTTPSSDDPTKLLNFVNNRIDINGTVNAIRDNKIGGDLYFLSKEGMVVGASGVINAGSLTVVTPTTQWWNDKNITSLTADNISDADIKAISNVAIPVNKDGTITVNGKLNTINDINLKAATINVGKEAGASQAAVLKTGVIEFENIVNLSDAQKTEAGLTKLAFVKDDANPGNIVLAAEQDYMETSKGATSGYSTEEVKAEVNISGGAHIEAVKAADVTATVLNNASTLSYQKTDGTTAYFINGESITEEEYKQKYSQHGEATNPRLAWGSKVNLTAKVNISDDGATTGTHTTIEGDRVNVEARSFNNYNSNNNSFWSAEGITSEIANLLFNGMDVNYGVLKSTAEVNIGAGSVLRATSEIPEFDYIAITPYYTSETAKYKTLNVRAYASDTVNLGASAGNNLAVKLIADAFFNKEKNNLSAIPGGAVIYGSATTDAHVNISGTLESAGTTNVEALANTLLNAKNAVAGAGLFEFGVTVLEGHNNATLNVEEAASLTSAKAMTLQANAENDFVGTTTVAGKDSSAVTLAIGFADYSSTATNNVKSKLIRSNADVEILANSNYTHNTFTASNTDGSSRFGAVIAKTLKDSSLFNTSVQKLAKGLNAVTFKKISGFQNLADSYLLTSQSGAAVELGKALAAGITVADVEETNKVNVNIANTANIEAGYTGAGNLNVKSTIDVGDIFVGASGTSNNYQKADPEGKTPASILFNGSVLVGQVENDANVNIAGSVGTGDSVSRAQLTANEGNVNIASETIVDYQRVQTMKKGLRKTVDNVKTSFDNLKDKSETHYGIDDETWTALEGYINSLQQEVENQYEQMLDKDGKLKPEYADNENGYAKLVEDMKANNEASSLNDFINTEKEGKFSFTYKDKSYVVEFDTKEKRDWWDKFTTGVVDLMDATSNSFGIVGNAMEFVDTNSYGNFFAKSVTAGLSSSPEHQDGAKVGGAITFGYTDLVNKANVNIGRNVSVKAIGTEAGKNNITVSTKANADVVNIDGTIMPSGGGDKGVGSAVIGTHFVDNNALTVVGAGASIKADNSLQGKADSKIMQVGINVGFPMSSGIGLEGNFTYLQGHSNDVLFVDDQAKLEAEAITLEGINDTRVVNVTGGLSMGATGGVGAAVGAVNISRNNLVLVADNEDLATMDSNVKFNKDAADKDKQDDEETRAKKVIAKKGNLSKDERAGYYTAASSNLGSIKTDSFKSNANTSGFITNVTADIGISMNSDADGQTLGNKIGDLVTNNVNRIANLAGMIDSALAKRIFSDPVGWQPKPTDQTSTNPQAGMEFPKFTLAASASAAINDIDAITGSVLDGITISSYSSAKPVSQVENVAEDSSGAYAIGGGASFNWNKTTQAKNEGKQTYAATGQAGINILNTYVTSTVKNSTLENISKLDNKASRDGAVVSVGAAVGLSLNDKTQIKSGAVGASVTVGESHTNALLQNNKVNVKHRKTEASLTNTALNKDLQATGGMNTIASFGGQSAASIGLTAAWTSLDNIVHADIIDGQYYVNGAFKNYAQTNLTQISVGMGLGFSTSEESKNFQGVAAMTRINNDVQANLKANDNAVLDIAAAYVENLANDEKMSSANSHMEALAQRGVEVTGNDYIKDAQSGAYYDSDELTVQKTKVENDISDKNKAIKAKHDEIDAEKDADKKEKLQRELDTLEQEKQALEADKQEIEWKLADNVYLDEGIQGRGNTIVTAALEIAAGGPSDDSKAGGAAVVFSSLDNDYNAHIKGATITTTGNTGVTTDSNPLVNIAKSNSLMVGVAAGANGTGGGVSGSGSAVIGVLNNDVISRIDNSTLVSKGVDIEALNTNKVIDVAGMVSVGKKAFGLDFTYNYMNTNTGAYLQDTDLTTAATTDTTKLKVLADDTARIYGIAMGVGVSTDKAAANGSIAANVGHNDVEAVVSSAGKDNKLTNIDELQINSKDNSTSVAAAGGLSVGKGVAAGGSFAYNQLGDLWFVNDNDEIVSDGKNQTNRASLYGYEINTTDKAKLDIKADDTSTLTTVSFGAALTSGKFAFEGANATDIVKKSTTATVVDANVNNTNNKQGSLNIEADSITNVSVVSGVIAGNFGGMAFGVAASENYMYDDTLAQLEGGNYYLQDALVKANSKQDLLSVGAGAEVGAGFTLGGSVLVNMLNNNTSAIMGDSNNNTNLTTTGNVGVLSYSKEKLRNFGGELSLSFGGAAGVGLSVAYNEILGSTNALVENAEITAEGDATGVSVHDSAEAARKEKANETYTEEKHTGLVVAADGRHELDNVMVTVAGAAGGESFAAGAGTIVANKLAGATKANIANSNINSGAQKSAAANQDVAVLATDFTKSLSVGGAAGVLLSGAPAGAGIGIASDNLVRSRLVEAGISGASENNQATINANKLKVNADAKSALKVNAVGIAVNGGGALAISGAGNITVANLTNATNAYVKNVKGTNNGFSVDAKQDNDLLLTTNALSLAAGSGVSVAAGLDFLVVDDTSSTEAIIENSTIAHYSDGTAEDELKAEHTTNMLQEAANLSLAIDPKGAAAAVILGGNNIDEHVSAKLINSNIGTETIKAKNYTQTAKDEMHANYINVEASVGAVGVSFGLDVNLIDNAVANNINNSHVYASEKIDVEAIEDRHVNMNAVAAAGGLFGGVGASMMITTIKDDADETYDDSVVENKDEHKGKGNGDASKADISGGIEQGNSAIDSQNTTSSAKFNKYIQKGKGEDYTTAEKFSLKTRSVEGEGVNINIKGSTLLAKNIDVITHATTDANQRIITAGGAGVAAGGLAVNVLKNKDVNSILIDKSVLEAENKATVKTLTDGEVKGEVYQGAVAATTAINGAYGFVSNKGDNSITVKNNSVITGKKAIAIEAKNNTDTEMQAIGLSVSSYGGGIMISRTTNDNDVEVKLENSTLKNTDDINGSADKKATISVAAIKNNILDNMSVAGAGGLAGLNGVFVSSRDDGDSTVNVKGTTISGGRVDISSTLTPKVISNTGSVAVGVGTLGVATTYATATGDSTVELDASSKVIGTDTINASALVSKNNNAANVTANMIAVTGSAGSLAINYGEAELNTNATLNSNAALSANKVILKADQQVLVKTDITGFDINGVSFGITSGEGLSKLNTKVNANANAESKIKDLEIVANTELATDELVDGLGFAIAGLSFASATSDEYELNTDVNINGDWNLTGKANISSINKNKIDTHVDATKATLVGYSGSTLDNEDTENATVTLENAKLTTDKELTVTAANIIDKKLDLDASGYGAATAESGSLSDTSEYNAKIVLNNAQLVTEGHEGEIAIAAYTEGNINDINKIKSAGVATGSFTSSDEAITYNNSIELGNNSSIVSKNADKDVTLAAYDMTDVNLKATADVQGAAIGSVSSANTTHFNRNNKITINSGNTVWGNNDVNVYAGVKEEGVMSRLDYNALADVYNHSVIALWTDPKLNNNMTLNNQVTVAGDVTSVRHTRLTANEGIATIAASEREYKLIGGTSGKGSITSTVLGETSPDEKIDNFINLENGKVT